MHLQIPFVKRAPMVTFRKPIGSVSVSGHKFVGAPVPCGVVITRKRYVMALSTDVEYLNSRDATIMVRYNVQQLLDRGSMVQSLGVQDSPCPRGLQVLCIDTGRSMKSQQTSYVRRRRSCGASSSHWSTEQRFSRVQGSRNGHAPIYMWYTLTRKGYEGMRKDVQKCLRNAHLLKVREKTLPASGTLLARSPAREM